MKEKFTIVGVVVALALGVTGLFVGDSTVVNKIEESVGAASAGPEYYNHQWFYGGLTDGSGVYTVTPTSASVTLTKAQLENSKVITFTASTTQAALTVTLPATTTFPLPNKVGTYRTWVIQNPFLAAGTTTTIAAGTGVDLQEPDGQNVVVGINNYAWLTCFRLANTDVACRVDETIPAD